MRLVRAPIGPPWGGHVPRNISRYSGVHGAPHMTCGDSTPCTRVHGETALKRHVHGYPCTRVSTAKPQVTTRRGLRLRLRAPNIWDGWRKSIREGDTSGPSRYASRPLVTGIAGALVLAPPSHPFGALTATAPPSCPGPPFGGLRVLIFGYHQKGKIVPWLSPFFISDAGPTRSIICSRADLPVRPK